MGHAFASPSPTPFSASPPTPPTPPTLSTVCSACLTRSMATGPRAPLGATRPHHLTVRKS